LKGEEVKYGNIFKVYLYITRGSNCSATRIFTNGANAEKVPAMKVLKR
jgi:hypothetical protein